MRTRHGSPSISNTAAPIDAMPYNPLNFTTLPSFVAARPNLRLHTEFAPLTSDRIAGALWEPPVRVANHLTSEGIIDRTPLSVMSDGKVDLSIKYTGEFSCHMRIEPYPFDSHDCYIEVTMPMTDAGRPGGVSWLVA
jgi:hypothetical protein